MKPVETGPKFGQFRVVRKGLTADDLVIVNGLMRARPGGKVIPQKTELEGTRGPVGRRSRHAGPGPAGE